MEGLIIKKFKRLEQIYNRFKIKGTKQYVTL